MAWEATTDGFVALFDMHGFRDFSYPHPHDNVLSRMEKIRHGVLQKDGTCNSADEEPNRLKATVFSDPVLVVSEDLSRESGHEIVVAPRCQLVRRHSKKSAGHHNKLPRRGRGQGRYLVKALANWLLMRIRHEVAWCTTECSLQLRTPSRRCATCSCIPPFDRTTTVRGARRCM